MALHEYKITFNSYTDLPEGEEVVKGSETWTKDGWIYIGDGSGLVLQVPEKSVRRIDRL